jgi:beta-galactosidase GanA
VFLLNYTEKTQSVTLDQAYQNALTGQSEAREVQIPAFDVKVLTTP